MESIIANQHIARRRAVSSVSEKRQNLLLSPPSPLALPGRLGIFKAGALFKAKTPFRNTASFKMKAPFKDAKGRTEAPLLALLHQETDKRRRDRSSRNTPRADLKERLGKLGEAIGKALRSGEDHILPPPLKDKQSLRPIFRALALLVLISLGCGLYAFASTRPYPLPAGGLDLPADPTIDDALLAYLTPELNNGPGDQDSLANLPLPKTLVVGSYTVRGGDSLASIAKRFGLAVDTIVSMNGIKSARNLTKGQDLKIPNMDGLIHVVSRGESLGALSRRYKVEMTLLADSNDLRSEVITPGQSIFIPGARLPASALRQLYGTTVMWPARGPLSSYFGYRSDPFTGVRSFHSGIDIVVDMGTLVKAAMDGRVADVGWNANYGNYVILSHAGGLQTLYGHLSSFLVKVGDPVSQGTVIAKSGNTGYSTGPHLHFGVYRNGVMTNPLKLLK
jgi:murein DD-endopeptidase MepM/ murein hydrolase activator NlpD